MTASHHGLDRPPVQAHVPTQTHVSTQAHVPMQARARRTRSEILTAAARLVIDRGQFSVKDLLAECRVTKGAMYYHFTSKDAVLDAVTAAAAYPVRTCLAAASSADAAHLVQVFGDCVAADPMVAATCVLWSDRDHHRAARAATRDPLQVALAAAVRTARPGTDADRTADLVVAVLTAHTATPGTTPGGEDDRAALTALVDHALTTVAVARSPGRSESAETGIDRRR